MATLTKSVPTQDNRANFTYTCVVTENSYSTSNNTSNVTITFSIKGPWAPTFYEWSTSYGIIVDGSVKKSATSSPYVSTSNVQLLTWTGDISHATDGSKTINIKVYLSNGTDYYLPKQYTSSSSLSMGSVTLTTIPRQATITSAPNFNDEANPTITYSNPAGNSVTSLQACIANTSGSIVYVAYRNISKTGTSYTFNLTDAERTTLRNATPGSSTLKVKFYVKTVISGSTFYSPLEKEMTIINGNPTFSSNNISYYDSSSTASITNNNTMIVKNKSNLMIRYTAATAIKGASISSYSFTVNGVTKTSTSAGGTVNFGTISSGKNLTLSASVTDSRGNTSSTVNKTITCYDYYAPSFIAFNAYRAKNANGTVDPNGNYLYCTYSPKYASVNGTNGISVTAYYTTGTTTKSVTGNNGVVAVDLKESQNTYTVYLIITDSYSGTGSSSSITVFGSFRALNVSQDGMGFAIGKMSKKDNSHTNGLFECRWDAQFFGTATGPSGFSTSSDERVKTNIQDVEIDIVDNLRPIQYELVRATDGKTHYGFIAQEVEGLLYDAWINPDMTGIIGHITNIGQQEYVLTYTEFIPLLTKKCQSLQAETNMLKQEIAELKDMIKQISS